MKILVCGDFHGNTDMTNALEKVIKENNIDLFCYIGDIQQMRSACKVDENLQYIDDTFYSKVNKLPVKSYVIPGNTDYRFIVKEMQKKYQNGNMSVSPDGFAIEFEKFNIVMYPKVSYSNHCLKEFETLEKYKELNQDFIKLTQVFIKQEFDYTNKKALHAEDYILYEGKFYDYYDDYYHLPDNYKKQLSRYMYDDLKELIDKVDNQKPIILLTHAPAHNTICDNIKIDPQFHVGSKDVRKIIEENELIKINVSGHIHQSVLCSKNNQYFDYIEQQNNNKCVCYTLGNTGIDTDYADKLNYIIVDTDKMEGKRHTLQLKNCQFPYTFKRSLV